MRWTNPEFILTVVASVTASTLAGVGSEVGGDSQSHMLPMVRSLFIAQDSVAQGESSGLSRQVELLQALADSGMSSLEGLKPTLDSAATVAGYVLSGGRPDLAEEFAKSFDSGSPAKSLLEGSARYMQGDFKTANAVWMSLEPENLPPGIAGRFALARGVLAGSDAKLQERYLAMAIAMMPGSLIEESALRRSALGHASAGAAQGFIRRVDRYLRRYPRSPYAPQFVDDVKKQIVRLVASGEEMDFDQLDLMLIRLNGPARRRFYLALAREAAKDNLPELTRHAAARLRRLSKEHSIEHDLGDLYHSLHGVADDDGGRLEAVLQGLDRQRIAGRDREFLDAARSIVEQLRAPLPQETLQASSTYESAGEMQAVSGRAKAALAAADDVLDLGKP